MTEHQDSDILQSVPSYPLLDPLSSSWSSPGYHLISLYSKIIWKSYLFLLSPISLPFSLLNPLHLGFYHHCSLFLNPIIGCKFSSYWPIKYLTLFLPFPLYVFFTWLPRHYTFLFHLPFLLSFLCWFSWPFFFF